MKRAVTKEPMFVLPDYTKPYDVEIDALDYAICSVLIQDEHTIAFESRKLNDTKRR